MNFARCQTTLEMGSANVQWFTIGLIASNNSTSWNMAAARMNPGETATRQDLRFERGGIIYAPLQLSYLYSLRNDVSRFLDHYSWCKLLVCLEWLWPVSDRLRGKRAPHKLVNHPHRCRHKQHLVECRNMRSTAATWSPGMGILDYEHSDVGILDSGSLDSGMYDVVDCNRNLWKQFEWRSTGQMNILDRKKIRTWKLKYSWYTSYILHSAYSI